MKRNEDSLRDLWDNIKHIIIFTTELPEGEERKGLRKIFEELIAAKFPNLRKKTVNQVWEAKSPIQD